MSQFVSQHILEWLLLLAGGALFVWVVGRLYRVMRPVRQRQSLHSDRRKATRAGGRRKIVEPEEP